MEDVDVSSACAGCSGTEELDSFSYDATPAEVVQQIEELTSLVFTQLGAFGTAPDLVIMRARYPAVPAPDCLAVCMFYICADSFLRYTQLSVCVVSRASVFCQQVCMECATH